MDLNSLKKAIEDKLKGSVVEIVDYKYSNRKMETRYLPDMDTDNVDPLYNDYVKHTLNDTDAVDLIDPDKFDVEAFKDQINTFLKDMPEHILLPEEMLNRFKEEYEIEEDKITDENLEEFLDFLESEYIYLLKDYLALLNEEGKHKLLELMKDELTYSFNSYDITEDDLENYVYDGAIEDYSSYLDSLFIYNYVYIPDVEDSEVAFECGLIPFELDGTFYLALGGCGMDLSPKLDAYVCLTEGRIPESSMLLQDKKYSEYVVGKELYAEAMRRAKRETPIVKISVTAYEENLTSLKEVFEIKE